MNCPGCGRHEFVIIAHMMISQFKPIHSMMHNDGKSVLVNKKESDITTHWCIGCSNCRGQWIVDAEDDPNNPGMMRVYRE